MRPLSGMSHAVGSVRRTLRSRRQPSSEKPTSATRRRIPCRWSKRQSAPACARLASRMARSAGASASSGAAAAAAIPSLTAGARAECDAGRRATDREARKEHFDRGQALAERAVALDDNSADAHFALFCNLGELMRLDGENLSQIFQLRRLMAEVDRTLELNPNHVDAMAAKGTLLVRLPRLLGGDSVRGEAMLREVPPPDPNPLPPPPALAHRCAAPGQPPEAPPSSA